MKLPAGKRLECIVTAGLPRAILMLALLMAVVPLRAGELGYETDGERASACSQSDVDLEALGVRIGEIEINALNIFNTDDPEENKGLFRLMNRLHARTRNPIVERQLLFVPGDVFRRQRLDESERILRTTSYLYDAEIRITSCDMDTVNIRVTTQDVWTLKPGIDVSRSGGESRVGIDLQEDNFLGRGGSVSFKRRNDEERRSTEIGYADRNIGGRWISLGTTIADNSDGHVVDVALARPFYSLDTRWALGGQLLNTQRNDRVYSLGDEIGQFRQDIKYLDAYGGLSQGLSQGRVQRWLGGVIFDDRVFGNVDDTLDSALIPGDRRLAYPYVEYQLIEDRFVRTANLDQIDRTEDVMLGARVRFRVGLLAESLGADNSGAMFEAEASRGYGDPARTFWDFSTHAEGRLEGGKLRNAVIGGTARWYLRQSERRLLFSSLRGTLAEELDLDNPLEIGGDNGLRGYPLRYQRGDARAQFTIEQRYFTDYYLWRLLRVGGAVFFDAGRVWGDNPYGGENRGLLTDIGFGLRLGSTRSSMGRMIHIDFAFPLNGDSSINSFQFVVEGKRNF